MTYDEVKLIELGDRVRFKDGGKPAWRGRVTLVTSIAITVQWDDGVVADFLFSSGADMQHIHFIQHEN